MRHILHTLAVIALLLAPVTPASAWYIFLNPSNQSGNVTPCSEYTYVEQDGCRDILAKTVTEFQQLTDVEVDTYAATYTTAVDLANSYGADYFICLHTNASGSGCSTSPSGPHGTAYVRRDSTALSGSERIRERIGNQFAISIRTAQINRMVPWGRNYNRGSALVGTYVATNTTMPVAYMEQLFHDHYDDLTVLTDTAGRKDLARGVVDGACAYIATPVYDDSFSVKVVDDGGTGWSSVGSWSASSDTLHGWLRDYRFAYISTPAETAYWRPQVTVEGLYDVLEYHYSSANRCTTTPFHVRHLGGMTDVACDQQVNNRRWNYLGSFYFMPGDSHWVALTTDGASGGSVIVADGIMFRRRAVTAFPDSGNFFTLDDDEAGFALNDAAAWTYVSGVSDGWRNDYYWTPSSPSGDWATWEPYIHCDGRWAVYAWYRAGTNRSDFVRYTVYHRDGAETLHVNQQVSGSTWFYLGTWDFEQGRNGFRGMVSVSDADPPGSGSVVIADAMRFVHVGPATPLGVATAPLAAASGPRLDVWPNPVRDEAWVTVRVTAPGPLRVEVRDLLGRSLGVIWEGEVSEAGAYRFLWRTADVSPGMVWVTDGQEAVRAVVK